MELTREWATGVLERCQAAATHGPWCDQLDRVLSAEERVALRALWAKLPGTFSVVSTLFAVMHGTADGYVRVEAERRAAHRRFGDFPPRVLQADGSTRYAEPGELDVQNALIRQVLDEPEVAEWDEVEKRS